MGIGETLRRHLAKLVMRAARNQAKTVCDNLQVLAGLKAIIKGETHAVGQQRLDRVRAQRREDTASDEEEETERVVVELNNLNIDTAGTEEEAAEGLVDALSMQIATS